MVNVCVEMLGIDMRVATMLEIDASNSIAFTSNASLIILFCNELFYYAQ
jgi:hypothetical protein